MNILRFLTYVACLIFYTTIVWGEDIISQAKAQVQLYKCPDALSIVEPYLEDKTIGADASSIAMDCFFKMKRYQEVIKVSTVVRKSNPFDFFASSKMIEALDALKEYDMAYKESLKLITLFNNSVPAHILVVKTGRNANRISDVIKVLTNFLQVYGNEGTIHLELAKLYLETEAWVPAKREARIVKRLGPITSDLYVLLGKLDEYENNLEEAEKKFQYGQKLNPQDPAPYAEESRLHFATGNYHKAQAVLENGLGKVSELSKVELFNKLAKIKIELKEPETARLLINNALSISPDSELAHYLYVKSYIEQSNLEEAISSLNKIIEQYPFQQWARQAKLKLLNINEYESLRSPASDNFKIYIIQPGDTLTKIAHQILGQSHLWGVIYEWNKSIIQDPDKLKIGTKLKICGSVLCNGGK